MHLSDYGDNAPKTASLNLRQGEGQRGRKSRDRRRKKSGEKEKKTQKNGKRFS